MKNFYFLLFTLMYGVAVNAQSVPFTDYNFRDLLVSINGENGANANLYAFDNFGNYVSVDYDGDGDISVDEALNIKSLYVSKNVATPDFYNITSVGGIEYFTNLKTFACANRSLTSLDVSALTQLESLYCNYNQIQSLNLSGLTHLQRLTCNNNALTSLDFSASPLIVLNCGNNQLTSLNLNNLSLLELTCENNPLGTLNLSGLNPTLGRLYCDNTQLTTLDVSQFPNLYALHCNNNQLTVLDVSNNTGLLGINCANNQINTLDFTHMTNLYDINCASNLLTNIDFSAMHLHSLICSGNLFSTIDVSGSNYLSSLLCDHSPNLQEVFMKNGSTETSVSFIDAPQLHYICADEPEIVYVQSMVDFAGLANCSVNSYCSFVPGGNYFTISGSEKFDEANDGCDASDGNLPNARFNIQNGNISGTFITNAADNYLIGVSSGTHIITPVLDNPSYFNVTPASVSVSFPTVVSPFTQNFCITANGVHPDLEISILPIGIARPGFDSKYKIIYKNKGNQTQSGVINFEFDDAILDLVIVNPAVSTLELNALHWNFSNLRPLEQRVIELTLNLNSPVEIPPVDNGDILNFTVVIEGSLADDTSIDNTGVLHQTVVNAIDPNDKTCLEGATITPEMVGKEVHYIIRFENTGTANAENIVVKDMIDATKFDVNSLVPLDGSHEFITRINGNKVEFIFENINLPFDDANNDGYVAFKIKTKPTLVLGDTFSNTASIYFDYNFPIVTEPAVTAIAVLAKQDFVFDNYFRISPNPASDVLKIESKQGIEVQSISIYNTLGQLVLVVPNAKATKVIDVSGLNTGNYFIKINTDKGTSNAKFIKS